MTTDVSSHPPAGGASSGVPRRPERLEVPGGAVDELAVPRDANEVGEVVREAASRGDGLLVVGGGTRLALANPARGLSRGLSTEAIAGIDEFEPDEGVVHARAGTRLATLRETVAREGWELPLDADGPDATVGGTIASAANGPRAACFGPVKDAILGLEVVGGDGVATKCGGRVVKNVTGYDLAKLYCGSFGSLAIVTGAWLRLRPAPARRETWRVELPATGDSLSALRPLTDTPTLRACVWEETEAEGHAVLTLELGGSPEAVEHDAARIRDALAAAGGQGWVGQDANVIDLLREARRAPGAPVVVRARALPSRRGSLRKAMGDLGLAVSFDVAAGTMWGRGELGSPELLSGLRAEAEADGGFAAFERLPDAWREGVDVFGMDPTHLDVIERLTRRFDPARVLGPGRFAPSRTMPEVSP